MNKEKQAIQDAGPGLHAELSKIGEELAQLNLNRSNSVAKTGLATRINDLERKITTTLEELLNRTTSIHADVESSLAVSEKKAKSLDELYREANTENELLYERFNSELEKVLKAVKGGLAADELRAQMKESQEEAAKLRKENQRLKRENLGLRSQLKGA